MRRISFLAAVVVFLYGCVQPQVWVKPGASTAEFYQAKSYCDALSTGATPMDYSNPGPSTTYHSGMVYGSGGGYGSYSGTSTTYQNNSAQAFANLGQSFRRQSIFDECMRGQGFVPEEEYSVEITGDDPLMKALGEPEREAVVNTPFARIFSDPSLGADVVGLLMEGNKVVVLSDGPEAWVRIRYRDKNDHVWAPSVTGYVQSARVTVIVE